MAAYIRFYQLDASPFGDGTGKSGLVLGTSSLRGALSEVKQGLAEGSPRICLTGSAGIGKTSFCRALPKLLGDSAQVAVVLNPHRPWQDVRATIAKRYKIQAGAISRKALLAAREDTKKLVLVIDQAESLSHESLDHLDNLLQYQGDEGDQLLHCVMLADLEHAASGTETPLLWWLDRFTTLQLQFSPIPAEGLRHYVEKHLAKAGWAGGELFTEEALVAIHRYTGGVPRAINDLCQKILVEGGAREISPISAEFIEGLYGDSPGGDSPNSEALAASPELSEDLSTAEFDAPPTAQEMLDDARVEGPRSDDETRGAREQLLEPAEDIASLIMTQDSAELLEVAGSASPPTNGSMSLELEHEPTAEAEPLEVYHHTRAVGAPVGMSRTAVAAPRRRSPIPTMIGLGVAAWLAYLLYSKAPTPTELIESAEHRIVEVAEVIEEKIGIELKLAVDPVEEVAEESSLAPSILDRPEMLVADPDLDIVPLPETQQALLDEESIPESTDELETEPLAASLASSHDEEPTKAPAATASEVASSVALSPSATPTASKTTPAPATAKPISTELIVVNEYTAIPEAASSGSTPSAEATLASETEPERAPKRAPESAAQIEPKRAPPTPAKLAPEPPAKADSAPATDR